MFGVITGDMAKLMAIIAVFFVLVHRSEGRVEMILGGAFVKSLRFPRMALKIAASVSR